MALEIHVRRGENAVVGLMPAFGLEDHLEEVSAEVAHERTAAAGLLDGVVAREQEVGDGVGEALEVERLNTLFSSDWREAPPSDPKVFAQVCRALLEGYCLRFTYFSPAAARTTKRLVEPHHLRYYMGAWILFAWDCDRRDWRRFYLTRIGDSLESLPWQTFTPRPRAEWEAQISANYGIFQGQKRYEVVLRFNEFRARWVRHQIWHENQTMRELPDGGVELTVPVADLREIQMEVMRFGSGVEVISPPELRQAVQEELARTLQQYEK